MNWEVKDLGKGIKFAILVLFLLMAVGFYGSLKVAKVLEDKIGTIEQLSSILDKTKGELEKVKGEKDSLQDQLAAQTEIANTLRARLEDKTREAEQLSERVKELQKYEEEARTLREKISDLEQAKQELLKKLAEAQEARKKLDIILAGGTVSPQGEKARVVEGYVIDVSPAAKTVTLGFEANAVSKIPESLFVHRGEEVVGKVSLRKVHFVTLVFTVEDGKVLEGIAKGDRIRLAQGQDLSFLGERLAGKVRVVTPPGFVSISIEGLDKIGVALKGSVMRGGKKVKELELKKILSAFAIVEVRDGQTIAGLKRDDVLAR